MPKKISFIFVYFFFLQKMLYKTYFTKVKNLKQFHTFFRFFASSKYLSEHGYPADFDDMLENHWIVSKGSVQTYMKSWKEVIKRAKHIRYDSNSASAAIDMVRNGAGIAVMPMRFKDEGLVCLDNFKSDNEITVYLVAKKKSKDNPRVRAVIDYYKQSLSRM